MKKKVLIVDDDADMTRALHLRLKAAGYDTLTAGDGIEATKQIKKGKPDLILLDLGLPAGDGFVVLERLRKDLQTSSIPVIVLSARDVKANRDKAIKAGARAFFQKPADNDELLEAIVSAIGPEYNRSN